MNAQPEAGGPGQADSIEGGLIGPLPPARTGGLAHSLAEIINAAPFGLTIQKAGQGAEPSGGRGFQLGIGAYAAGTGPRRRAADMRERRFSVALDGVQYELALELDESEFLRRQEELIRQAYFDALTGLPNRTLIERSVTALMDEPSSRFALAFIDLDGFKYVNDYYGHHVGDRLLEKLAQRLQAMLRPSDMLARLSGDEFVLLISPAGEAAEVIEAVEQYSARIKEPFFLEGYEVMASASIGVCIHPEHGRTYEELHSNADRAMYRGKGGPGGCVHFFEPEMEHAAIERSRLEQRIRLAIRDRRVICAYQPKVNMRTRDIVGLEVLMRWKDEDGYIQAPGDFLTLAVELGLMDELTFTILDQTTAEIDQINETFGASCPISINVAARQAGDVRFMARFVERIDATGYAERFTLELTEEAFLARAEFQRDVLPMIRRLGISVSIDDFGVGYSSLSALAEITADEVKVDRSFITDIHKRPRNQSILRTIEALAQSLGMNVVVEGVETFEEVAYLQAATRISCAQGYYFARPLVLGDTAGHQAGEQARGATFLRKAVPQRKTGIAFR